MAYPIIVFFPDLLAHSPCAINLNSSFSIDQPVLFFSLNEENYPLLELITILSSSPSTLSAHLPSPMSHHPLS